MTRTTRTRRFLTLTLTVIAAIAVLAATGMLPAATAEAATFTIVNGDGADEGFNDTTAATPVGGNTGTTIGEQRLIAFQYAADLWGALLASNVDIRVQAKFDPLACNAVSGVLGSAGPTMASRNFANAPVADTFYVAALANALSGTDLAPGSDDLTATFNSMLGTPGCLEGGGFYLGLDGNTGGLFDFVSVLAHELGHGLGFLSLVDTATGALFFDDTDAFVSCLEDHSIGEGWPDMSNAERLASMIDGTQSSSDLHWTCPNAISLGDLRLTGGIGGDGHIGMYAPNPFEGGSSISHYAKTLAPNELMEPSYVGPNHDIDMSVAAFKDLGWPMAITDCSGEMGGTPCDDADDCTGIDLCDAEDCTGLAIFGCTTTSTLPSPPTTLPLPPLPPTTTTLFPPPTTTTTTTVSTLPSPPTTLPLPPLPPTTTTLFPPPTTTTTTTVSTLPSPPTTLPLPPPPPTTTTLFPPPTTTTTTTVSTLPSPPTTLPLPPLPPTTTTLFPPPTTTTTTTVSTLPPPPTTLPLPPPPPTTTTLVTPPTTTTTLPTPLPTTTTTSTGTTLPMAGSVCGDPVGAALSAGVPHRGALITASDALYVLNSAVGAASCLDCVCDVNDSGAVTATDALFVLNAAVGLDVTLMCPAC